MKNHNGFDPVDPDMDSDWLEALAVARPAPEEVARRRRELAGRPAELRRLEQELALNALLDARPGAPRAASNFAALVQQRIAAEDRQALQAKRGGAGRWWWRWLGPHPAWALTAVAVVCGITGTWGVRNQQYRSQMAASVATVALTASSPGLSADSLEDYEVIRRLGAVAQPGDDALIAALAERTAP